MSTLKIKTTMMALVLGISIVFSAILVKTGYIKISPTSAAAVSVDEECSAVNTGSICTVIIGGITFNVYDTPSHALAAGSVGLLRHPL